MEVLMSNSNDDPQLERDWLLLNNHHNNDTDILLLLDEDSSGFGSYDFNSSGAGSSPGEVMPTYIRLTTTIILSCLLLVGITGNVLVPIVIAHSKDLRNSTNVFLVNLALADLLVILICLPTGFVELHSTPGVWYLGETMCLVVTFVELIAPHASVLTILAISFERYYAICQPLRAGYVCTKSRATIISLFTWLCAGILTSPIIGLTEFEQSDELGSQPSCGPQREQFWTKFYYIASFSLFFLIPCIILLILYALIAQHLIREPVRIGYPSSAGTGILTAEAGHHCGSGAHQVVRHHLHQQQTRRGRQANCDRLQRHQNSNRARRQVVAMLGTVVVSFFVCLLPFRLLTLISVEDSEHLSAEVYYLIVNFCRIMVYLNSAVNPILYNLMSSKFRNGFLRLFGLKGFARQGTFTSSSTANTNTNTSSSAVAAANAAAAASPLNAVHHKPVTYRLSSNPPCGSSAVLPECAPLPVGH